MYLNAAERPPPWLHDVGDDLLADSENTTGEHIFYKSYIKYELIPVEAPEQSVSFFSIHMDYEKIKVENHSIFYLHLL
jgi:hypothetical protein